MWGARMQLNTYFNSLYSEFFIASVVPGRSLTQIEKSRVTINEKFSGPLTFSWANLKQQDRWRCTLD